MEKVVTSKADCIGRVLIPKILRSQLDIEDGTEMDLTLEGNTISLKVSVPRCVFCKCEVGQEDVQLQGKFVCGECVVAMVGR